LTYHVIFTLDGKGTLEAHFKVFGDIIKQAKQLKKAWKADTVKVWIDAHDIEGELEVN